MNKQLGMFVYSSSRWRFKNHIQNNSFSLLLTNGPTRLECYSTLGRKGLPERNSLAYGPIHNLLKNEVFWMDPLSECYSTLSCKGKPERNTPAYWPIYNLWRIRFLSMVPGTVFTILQFLCNMIVGTLSQSVTVHKTGNACQRETL